MPANIDALVQETGICYYSVKNGRRYSSYQLPLSAYGMPLGI